MRIMAMLRCIFPLVLSFAPAPESAPPEPVQPTLEDAQLMVARDLHIRGERSFRAGDYRGAIEAWTQVLVLLPDKQADLRVPLAYAHRGAYLADEDVEHLHAAQRLFSEQLASLAPQDAARSDIETELAEIEAELAARAAAEAQAQAARDDAIRQEQIRLNQQLLAESEARRQRKLQTIYYGVGGSSVGVGLGLLGWMTAALVVGAKLEREGHDIATMVGVPDDEYAQQLAKGAAQNRIALATGIVGGLLTSAGVTLLSVTLARRERDRASRVTASPTCNGVELRF
jgi:hypothetical protein